MISNSHLMTGVQPSTIGGTIPARLHVEQTAEILGFQPHDIPILISKRLLKPLGNPVQNAPKFFAAVEIMAIAQNIQWLNKATKVLTDHWKMKNSKSRKQPLSLASS